MPPPWVDSQSSRVVPKCARKSAALNCSPSKGVYMMPSTSPGARPASVSARSIACAAISFVVRPDAFVWSASPTPAIATSPETSSRSAAKPQSVGRADIGAAGVSRDGLAPHGRPCGRGRCRRPAGTAMRAPMRALILAGLLATATVTRAMPDLQLDVDKLARDVGFDLQAFTDDACERRDPDLCVAASGARK